MAFKLQTEVRIDLPFMKSYKPQSYFLAPLPAFGLAKQIQVAKKPFYIFLKEDSRTWWSLSLQMASGHHCEERQQNISPSLPLGARWETTWGKKSCGRRGPPLWCCCQARTPGLCLGYCLHCQQKHLLKWLGTCVFLELFLDDGSRNSLELVGTQNGNWLEGWSVSRNAQRFRTGPIGFVSSSVYKAGDSSHVSHHIMNSSHLKKRLVGLPAMSAFLWKGLWIKGPLLVH